MAATKASSDPASTYHWGRWVYLLMLYEESPSPQPLVPITLVDIVWVRCLDEFEAVEEQWHPNVVLSLN